MINLKKVNLGINDMTKRVVIVETSTKTGKPVKFRDADTDFFLTIYNLFNLYKKPIEFKVGDKKFTMEVKPVEDEIEELVS